MRYNYASAECGSRIVGGSKGASGAAAVLSGNRDTYMLSQCSIPARFVIIELCQEVRVDGVSVSNFEYYSSTFAKVKLSVAKRHRPKGPLSNVESEDANEGWTVVGEWVAKKGRGEQEFLVDRPMPLFTRFVRVDLIGHHGNEYYCSVTTIKIFGKTMMEEYVEESDAKLDGTNALATLPSRYLQLARVISESINPSQTCPSASFAEQQAGSSDNVFKAIHERLCVLEKLAIETGEMRAQVDGLARIVVNMAAKEHRWQSRLPSPSQNCGINRAEFYSALGLLSLLIASLLFLFMHKYSRHSHNLQSGGRHDFTAESNPPLDLPNSDYLGLSKTPTDSGPQSPTSPVRRRSGYASK